MPLMQPRPGTKKRRKFSDDDLLDRDSYMPTAEEIAAACQEIQSRWSDSDRRRRQSVRPVPATIPTNVRIPW